MTGGGLGGCTVNLVRSDCVDAVKSNIARTYEVATGIAPDIYVCEPAQGENPGQSRGAFKVETPECRKQPAQIATLVASQRQLEPAGIALSRAAEFALVSGASAGHYPAARVPGRGHRPRLGR